MKFIRVRPYDKRRGQLVRRYVYGGFRFEENHGWYEVDDEIADYLEKVLTHPEDPDSKPVFDVADQVGAEKIAHEEYEAANPERKISEATAGRQRVTLDDLDEDAKGKGKGKGKASSTEGKKEKPAKGGEKTEPPESNADPKATESGKKKSKP